MTQGFKEAKEAGMFVITLHEGVKDNSNVDCVVACSLAETGYEAIRLEVEELGEAFNLAIVNGSEAMEPLWQSARATIRLLKSSRRSM